MTSQERKVDSRTAWRLRQRTHRMGYDLEFLRLPDERPVAIGYEQLQDALGVEWRKDIPELICASGYRFRKVENMDLATLTVAYVWEERFWQSWRAQYLIREWFNHWKYRIRRLREAW